MSLQNLLTEKAILPISDWWLGHSVSEYFNFLMISQFWTREEIDAWQNEKLRELINHAYNSVPYYHKLFNSLGLKPSDIQTKSDLHKIPVLTKAIIKQEGQAAFLSTSYPQKKTYTSSSSGSTGEPLFYKTTKDAYSMNLAASLRGWFWLGYKLGDKYIKLSQNSRSTFVKRMQDKFNRNLYLPTDPLNEENFIKILKNIEAFEPKVIRGYPDPLLFLSQFKAQNPNFKFKPTALATTGNTLYPETRKQIEDAFGCKIFDAYNCEGNAVVFECPSHTCYHSTEEYGISELLIDDGMPVKKGIGRLISTDLYNFAHPFIRYDTQDLLEIDDSACVCGRKHLKIMRIIGRDNDVIGNKEGRKFIVHNFTVFFQSDSPEMNQSVDRFQIVKMKDGSFSFRLIVNRNYNSNVEKYIKNYWEERFLQPVRIELVNELKLTSSGKHRFVINE